MSTYLNWKWPEAKGWRVNYDAMEVKLDRLVFYSLDLSAKNKMLELSSDMVEVTYKRVLHLLQPKIVFDRQGFLYPVKNQSLADSLSTMLRDFQVVIDDGTCRFLSTDADPIECALSFKKAPDQRALGILNIAESLEKLESEGCKVKLFAWPKELILETEVKQLSLSMISSLVSYFTSESTPVWQFHEGIVDGHIWLGIGENNRIEKANALLSMNGMEAVNRELGLALSGQQLGLDLSFPDSLKAEQSDGFFQQASIKTQIEGGNLIFSSHDKTSENVISDLNGEIRWGSFKDSEISLKGYLHHDTHVSPLVIKGSPSFSKQNTLDVGLRLFLKPEMRESTKLHLSIGHDRGGELFIKGLMKDLHADQLLLFQELLARRYPSLLRLMIEDGTVTCGIKTEFDAGHLKRLWVENVDGKDLQFSLDEKYSGRCARIQGALEVDLHHRSMKRFPNWTLRVEEGALHVVDESKPVSLSELECDLEMKDGVFSPSDSRFNYNGIKGKIQMWGEFERLACDVGLSSPLEVFLNQIDCPMPLGEGMMLHTMSHVERKSGFWQVEGGITLKNGSEHLNHVRYGCQIDRLQTDDLLKELRGGWVQGEDLHLDDLRHTLPETLSYLDLDGAMDLRGTFSPDGLFVEFLPKNVYVRTPAFHCHLGAADEERWGQLNFGLKTHQTDLQYRMVGGSYLELNTGMDFRDIKGLLEYKNDVLTLHETEFMLDGVNATGELTLDHQKEGASHLHFKTSSVDGTLKQLEMVYGHFIDAERFALPFNGRIGSQSGGFEIDWIIQGDKPPLWSVNLDVSHIAYNPTENVSIHDLHFNLDYQSELDTLRLGGFQGFCNEYTLFAPELTLYLDQTPHVSFDVRLENGVSDIVRLAGKSIIADEKIQTTIDQERSHLYSSPITSGEFALDFEGQLLSLKSQYDLALCNLHEYVDFFRPLLKENFPKVSGAEGSLYLDLDYKRGESLKCSAQSDLVKIVDKSFHGVYCAFEKQQDHIFINQGKVGEWTVQLDGTIDKDVARFKTINCACDHSHFSSKEGFFDMSSWKGELPIDWLRCGKELFTSQIEGLSDLYFTGKMFIDSEQTEIQLALKTSQLEKIQCQLDGVEPLTVTYDYADRIYFEGGKVTCRALSDQKNYMTLSELSGVWVLGENKLSIDKGHIAYKPEVFRHPWLEEKMKAGEWKGGIRKKGGATDVALSCTYADGVYSSLLKFSEGTYQIGKQDVVTSGFEVRLEPHQVNGKGALEIYGSTYDLDLVLDHWDFTSLNCQLFERESGNLAMFLDAELKNGDIQFHQIYGDFLGMQYRFLPKFQMQDASECNLMGEIKMDISKMHPMMNKELKEFVQKSALRRGYEVAGELIIDKKRPTRSRFSGVLKGKNFDAFGYQFKTLMSELHVDATKTTISNLLVSDPAAWCDVPQIALEQTAKNGLMVNVPSIVMKDIRPSLLKKGGRSGSRLKPFVVKSLEFRDIHGRFDKPETLQGKGHLSFENSFKREPTFLDIPKEILGTIGLDLKLLVPITGEIDLELAGGKVMFKKLKNSYSEGHRSSFYLSGKRPSYVDLDGNIQMSFKMKQNVLFKITQLFILSVDGTLEEPHYSLK